MNNGNKNTIFKLLICFFVIAIFCNVTTLKSDVVIIENIDKFDLQSYFPESINQDTLLQRKAYFTSYSFKHGQSSWVLYNLKKEHLFGDVSRKNNFKADPDIYDAISPKLYSISGYDKGHLAPAADFSWSEQAMEESFYMSNISPQKPGFNRGIWKKLEDKVRKWAEERHSLIVLVGPVLSDTLTKLKNKVSIPEIFYKIILDKEANEAISFLMKNDSSSLPISYFAVSIDSIEKISGINFFYLKDSTWQKKVECCFDVEKWNIK
jgi:endonuclease G